MEKKSGMKNLSMILEESSRAKGTSYTGDSGGHAFRDFYRKRWRSDSEKIFPTWRNLYICTELCGEPFPGIGSADVYHRHGKGDRCNPGCRERM